MNLNPIHKFVDYILLNASSMNRCGLYEGKAGMSLCLFEIAGMLGDDYTEEVAFGLLEECLVQKETDITFERGLSGRGFVLSYLIKNKFIEADFEELFDKETKMVLDFVNSRKNNIRDIRVAYFLFLVWEITGKDEYGSAVNTLIGEEESALASDLEGWKEMSGATDKVKLLRRFNDYLKSMLLFSHSRVDDGIIDLFLDVYDRGLAVSNLATGYYIKRLTANPKADKIIASALNSLYPDTMSIAHKIDTLYLLRSYPENSGAVIDAFEASIESSFDAMEGKRLLRGMDPLSSFAGYGGGLSRLLLYQVFLHDKDDGAKTDRFDFIF